MVMLSQLKRLALNPRQILGLGDDDDNKDGGLLGGLFGGDDEEETTTAVTATSATTATTGRTTGTSSTATSSTSSASETTATQTESTTAVGSRPPTLPTQTSSTATESSSVTSSSSTVSQESTTSSEVVSASSVENAPQTTAAPPPPVIVTITSDDGAVATITSTRSVASDASTPSAAVPQTSKGFLENKPVSGAVFGVAGLVGLVVIVLLITMCIRRRKNKQLVNDAVSFDPSNFVNHHSQDVERNSIEKASYYGASESGHGHGGQVMPPTTYQSYDYNTGYGAAAPSPSTYYSNAAGYGQQQQQQSWGYNTNPVQLPSANVGGMEQRIPRVAPPPLLPTMNDPNAPMSAGLPSGYSLQDPRGPPGIPFTRTPSPMGGRRVSYTGSPDDNAYLGAKDFKIANV